MSLLEDSLGKILTVKELSNIFGVDDRILRKHYKRFGGVKISPRKIVFFEKEVVNAIQTQRRLSRTNQVVRWNQKSKINQVLQNKEGSDSLGGQGKGEIVRIYDEHGIFGKLGNKVP